MSRLTELKEKYAVQQGFDSWKELWFDTTDFKHANERIDELVKLYAKECSQASLEKASESAKTQERIDEKSGSYHWVTIVVDKESITNESNIVLL